MYKLLMLLMSSICLLSTVNSGTPIATGGPSLIQEGKDALLTCVVSENRHNNTVIWKKQDEVLTAGKERVSSDLRISILHDEDPKGKVETGGEVWVLLIRKLKPSDSGSYICELNSEPVLRSIHILTVKTLSAKYNNSSNNSDSSTFSIDSTMSEAGDIFLVPPHLDAPDTSLLWLPSWEETQYHDFTDCCERANITSKCMGFCYIHNILDGRTDVEPEACEKDFPQIVRCMADGRNHVPCCVEKQIPDLCQDMCRGEYTPFTDLLRTRVSCVQYTVSGLKCILQGVQQIPSSPLNVGIDEVNETRVVISWSPPEKLAHLVKNYSVNLTALHSFDEDDIDGGDYVIAGGIRKEDKNSIIRLVSRNVTSITINGLRPLTMYAITVIAVNEYGSSLPSERLRIFTHTSALATENQSGPLNKMEVPDIPDIRSCCQAHGMTYRMCLDKMCDPQKTDLATVADFMVCAPWSNITFTCLANNIDHTPCCRARGIPSACYPLCSGKVSTLDFNLFKCLRFMSEFSSCLFQGYGVLADPPTKLHIVAKTDSFIILDWNKPKRLADTISTFHVKFRHLSVGDDYFTVVKKNPPLILEGLEPNVYYEFYVVSINAYGKSEPSPRLIVRTRPAEIKSAYETKYSISTCCRASGLLPQCSPLCTYNIRVSDIEVLEPECREQMSVIARCAAGGRDHTPCCTRRGVPLTCMSLCRGVLPVHHSTALNYTHECLSYAGNILQCFEEGTGNIPGPVENLHATLVTNNSISLVWSQPDVDGNNKVNDISITTTTTTTTATATTEGSVDDKIAKAESSSLSTSGQTAINDDIYFIVQYGKVNNMTIYETVAKLGYEITTNETSIDLINLEPNTIYRIMVLTRGIYGTSLPSSMLLINTTEIKRNNNDTETTKVDQQQSTHIYGAPSPPHSLVIVAHSATWLQLSWQPPEYLHPHEKISYRVYHKSIKEDKYNVANTKVSWLRFSNLKPSSQHILYVEAVGEKAISLPSETLVAWTDPALPAFVDPPSVHPADNIPEGGAMTILCLALGNPAPTISLYVGGHLMRQDTSRHMVTVIHNVTADMEHVSCYADNGYGVPMQATRRVNICYPPKIQAAGITVAAVGDEVELRCMVDSKPVPKTFFWRDHDGRVPVIQGGNYDISIRTNESHPTVYTMALRINKLQATDVGDYFCHAENPFGSATIPVSVRIRNTRTLSHNVSECCAEMNVTMACRSACTYYVDIDAVADRPECITEFDKLMKCAADGSDHRTCCAESFVPRKCLNWCRGEAVRSKEICSLEYAKVIVGCFESHRDRLPGPPENVAVSVISDSEVMVRWDPPTKNPNVIEGYRIFFHEAAIIGSEPINSNTMTGETLETGGTLETSSPSPSSSMFNNATSMQINGSNGNFSAGISTYDIWRIDVKKTSVTIQGLKKGILYELVVKAGNVYGASVLSKPITFTLGDHHVTSATYSHAVGTISGIVASILAVLLAAAAIIFYRRHRANGKTATGVAFENPTYTRGLEQVQLPTVTSALTHTTNMNGGNLTTRTPTSTHATTTVSSNMPVPTTTTLRPSMTAKVGNSALIGASTLATQLKGTTDKTSNLDGIDAHTQCNEINPTIYEELKLGQEGAGFRKLVP